MSAILSLHHVTRTLQTGAGPVTLVRDVSLDFMPGTFVSVLGASGSGKSSLLYLMGLLDQPTQGEIEIAGTKTVRAHDDLREKIRLEKIGFVFQFHFLLQEFSALDNVLLPMRKLGKLSDKKMRARGQELLERLGLGKMGHKHPNAMSGGERQRVAIARAMANAPSLILADEPTGNLDSKNSAAVLDIFRGLVKDEGVTIVTVTHDQAFADRTDRQVHMRDGQVISDSAS